MKPHAAQVALSLKIWRTFVTIATAVGEDDPIAKNMAIALSDACDMIEELAPQDADHA